MPVIKNNFSLVTIGIVAGAICCTPLFFLLGQVDRHAEVPHRGADVAVQDLLELLPVPPLEHDLAQLEQDAQLIGGGGIWHSPSLPADSGYMGPA